MKIVNFSIFLDKMGENNITRGLNMFYVIDKKTETGAQGFVVLNEKKDGAKRDYDECPSRIHNFDNTREGSLQGIKYCANQRAINLDKHYDWYDALHEFFEILGENATEDDVSLIEGVYNSFNLKKLKDNLENNIKKQKPREVRNNLFVYNLAKFPKILARMIGVNEELCADLSKAILREDYQAAFNLLSEDNVKSSDVAGTNDEIDVWKYVSFNENSSYNSITSYEYIDQDTYKKETFIDQDTYIPTIFKHYYPTRNSYKYAGSEEKEKERCIKIPCGEQLSKRVEALDNYIWGLKYIHNGDYKKRKSKEQLAMVFNSNKDDYKDDSRMRKFQRFDNLPNYQDYKGITRYICDLVSTFKLDNNIKYVLMPYPSSKKGNTNMVQIISKILGADPEYSRYFIDGSDIIERIADEASAHEGDNDARDVEKHMESLEIKTDKVKQYKHENVIFVVFDDVTTTGSSLEALDRLLQDKGIKNIINFVFGKSLSWYSFIEQEDFKFNSKGIESKPQLENVKNIIWDLDNTLKEKGDTEWYGGLDKILNDSRFKHRIVTNRSKNKMSNEEIELIDSSNNLDIVPNNKPFKKFNIISIQDGHREKLYWEYDFLDGVSKTIKNPYFSKPSSFPVENALYEFNKEDGPRYSETCKNTIGVGNNEADIAAYKRAGIYSVLVRWGNKAKIEDTFGADECFDTVEDFTKWLQSRM